MPDKEPVGITFGVPSTSDPLPVREVADGVPVIVTDNPFLMTDGKSLQAPIPVVLATEGQDALGVSGLSESPPVNLMPPVASLSGAPVADVQLVICSSGSWSGVPSPSISYQWQRGGNPIAGATSSSYSADLENNAYLVSCEVTATNDSGYESVESNTIEIPAKDIPP